LLSSDWSFAVLRRCQPSELTVALEDCMAALDLFLSNDFEEALARLRTRWEEDPGAAHWRSASPQALVHVQSGPETHTLIQHFEVDTHTNPK
jgi:hypothetical protein